MNTKRLIIAVAALGAMLAPAMTRAETNLSTPLKLDDAWTRAILSAESEAQRLSQDAIPERTRRVTLLWNKLADPAIQEQEAIATADELITAIEGLRAQGAQLRKVGERLRASYAHALKHAGVLEGHTLDLGGDTYRRLGRHAADLFDQAGAAIASVERALYRDAMRLRSLAADLSRMAARPGGAGHGGVTRKADLLAGLSQAELLMDIGDAIVDVAEQYADRLRAFIIARQRGSAGPINVGQIVDELESGVEAARKLSTPVTAGTGEGDGRLINPYAKFREE